MANTVKEYRTKLRQDPHSVLDYVSKDIDIIVKTNTKDTIHILIPQNNYDNLGLGNIAAGAVHLETVGSAGSVSTFGTVAFSTASTASTVSTSGTANI